MTHPGQHRERNEDFYGVPPDLSPEVEAAKGRLYVVADGVGGHQGGAEASRMAVARVLDEYYRDASLDWRASLLRAIRMANADVYRMGARASGRGRPATTLTAAVIRGPDMLVANVGDSRVYLIRGRVGRQLTQDHTPVADGIRSGLIDPARASTHPQHGQINRAIGRNPDVQADLFHYRLEPGDKVLLCSDGLTNEVGDAQIFSAVDKSPNAQQAAKNLVGLANRGGGRDNITAVVVSLNGDQAQGRGVLPVGWMVMAAAALAVILLVGGVTALIINQTRTAEATTTEIAVTDLAAVSAVPTGGSPEGAHTPVPPTVTPGMPVTETDTPIPTATAASEVSETVPEVIPTDTPTPTATHTPTATRTPRGKPKKPPTATPYPTPQPQLPAFGAEITDQDTIILEWHWDGKLEANQHFDVRVWREGQKEEGVAWTKATRYDLYLPAQKERLIAPDPQGLYYWRIVVVQGTGGEWEKDLAVGEESQFTVRTSAPVPPTSTPRPSPTPTFDPGDS